MLDVVAVLVTALWPPLWQRWLKDVEHAALDLRARRLGGAAARPARAVPGAARRRRPVRRAARRGDRRVGAGTARPGVGAGDRRRRAAAAAVVGRRRRRSRHRGGRHARAAARRDRSPADEPRPRHPPAPPARGARPGEVDHHVHRPGAGPRRVGGDGRAGARRRATTAAALPGVRAGAATTEVRAHRSATRWSATSASRSRRSPYIEGRREVDAGCAAARAPPAPQPAAHRCRGVAPGRGVQHVDPAVRDRAARRRAPGAGQRRRAARWSDCRTSPASGSPSTHPTRARSPSPASSSTFVRRCAPSPATTTPSCPAGPLFPAVAAVSDTSSHRFDPWLTALATRRLRRLDAHDVPRRIGAYGWVDDLDPSTDPTPPTRAGFLHAPGQRPGARRRRAARPRDQRRRGALADPGALRPRPPGGTPRRRRPLRDAHQRGARPRDRTARRRAAARARAAPAVPGPTGVEGPPGVRRPAGARRRAGDVAGRARPARRSPRGGRHLRRPARRRRRPRRRVRPGRGRPGVDGGRRRAGRAAGAAPAAHPPRGDVGAHHRARGPDAGRRRRGLTGDAGRSGARRAGGHRARAGDGVDVDHRRSELHARRPRPRRRPTSSSTTRPSSTRWPPRCSVVRRREGPPAVRRGDLDRLVRARRRAGRTARDRRWPGRRRGRAAHPARRAARRGDRPRRDARRRPARPGRRAALGTAGRRCGRRTGRAGGPRR